MDRILHDDKALAKFNSLKEKGLILLEVIVGSQAYGTALPTSDVDKKFVYIEDMDSILAGTQTEQLNVNKDYVGYELARFCELLASGNPNLQDLLKTPEDCVEYMHPLFNEYFCENYKKFLTKKVEFSYGAYAKSQIQKARGTNKKIVNPMAKERKGLSDFIWVAEGQGSILLKTFLSQYNLDLADCGLSAIDHMKNTFNVFIAQEKNGIITPYKGIVDKDDVQVVLDSIGKEEVPLCQVYVNIEGFQAYCKEYREYWEWVGKRNEVRYNQNIENGAEYDSKNMAHCHRLLDMCIEILTDGSLNIRRPNREQLLEIRAGKYSYDQLIKDAEEKNALIKELVKTTELPEDVDMNWLHNNILQLRKRFYQL